MRRLAANAMLLLASTGLILLVAEAIVRALFADSVVLYPRYHTGMRYGDFTLRGIRPDSEFWHTSVDGRWRFQTNSRGFRNEEDVDYDKPACTLRVLALGDSHTQGYEVRQAHTYSAIIERSLRRDGVPAQVINAGVSGFSTAEALAFLAHEGVRYRPDVVVLGFYRNDIEDNLKAGLYRLDENGELVVARSEHLPGVWVQDLIYAIPGVKWLGENSYLYSVAFNTTWEFFKERLRKRTSSVEDAAPQREFAVPVEALYSESDLRLAAALLRELHRVASRHGARLVVIDIPVRGRVTAGRPPEGPKIDQPVFSSFPGELAAVARRHSDAFVDAPALLADYSAVAELHVPNGLGHITEFTHTVIGVAAAASIKALQPPGGAAGCR